MWTEEQFIEIREFLDLRKSEILDIKNAINTFPMKVEYSQLSWDVIKATWELFEPKEYPIHQLILDIWCEDYLRDIIIDELDDYNIYYDPNINCIEIIDVVEKENASKNWRQKIIDKIDNKFQLLWD